MKMFSKILFIVDLIAGFKNVVFKININEKNHKFQGRL